MSRSTTTSTSILAGMILCLVAVMFFWPGTRWLAADDVPAPKPELAFAVNRARTTTDGRLYPAFYGYVISPHAVAAGGRVYCAFQNADGCPTAMAYDIAEKSWAGPVEVSSFGLGRDSHGNPSLCVDRRGHLHVFYGCHGGPMRHARGTKPYDIAAWEERPAAARRATYPQSMRMADDTIRLFYRAGGHMAPWTMQSSSDDCFTWSEPEAIIEMRLAPRDPLAAAYCNFFPGTDGKTIHCFWNHKDDNASRVRGDRKHPWRPLKYPGLHEAVYRYNVYYVRRDPDGAWRNAAGRKMELPISKARADAHCLVYDSGDEFTLLGYKSRLAVDAAERPYVKIYTGVVDWTTGLEHPKVSIVPMRSKFARFAPGGWQISDRMPGDWPAEVAAVISARGLAAYGDRSAGRWFIFTPRYPIRPGTGSFVFLYNEKTGYATRKGGPAMID